MGSIPTSYLLVKWMHSQDIRELGSRNPGAANVFRVIGKREGALVLVFDILKGFLAVWVLSGWVVDHPFSDGTFKLMLGMTSVLGHAFTPFLKFKGGKGVATGAGAVLAVYPLPLFIGLSLWALVLAVFRYMSLASIIGAYGFAVACPFFIDEKAHAAIAFGAALFITWTHRANIRRLIKGEEPRFSVRK